MIVRTHWFDECLELCVIEEPTTKLVTDLAAVNRLPLSAPAWFISSRQATVFSLFNDPVLWSNEYFHLENKNSFTGYLNCGFFNDATGINVLIKSFEEWPG